MKKNLKFAAILVICLLLLVLGGYLFARKPSVGGKEAGEQEMQTKQEIQTKQERCIVKLQTKQLVGSGIIWGLVEDEDEVHVLTVGHLLKDISADDRPVLPWKGRLIACDSYIKAEHADAALLIFRDKELIKEVKEGACEAVRDKAAYDALRYGDFCVAIGCDGLQYVQGNDEKETLRRQEGKVLEAWIYMENYGQYMMWTDAEIAPGMSGGGLFDADGNFLGILSGGSEDGQSAIVPLGLILSEFHNYLD
jgi:S1-C subfamily serine protease